MAIPAARAGAQQHMQERLSRLVQEATWTSAFTPTLQSLEPLKKLLPVALHHSMLSPPSGVTEFELADGKPMLFLTSRGDPMSSSLKAKADLFDEIVLPAAQKPVTRIGNYAAWRSFVTFLATEDSLEEALPASETALKGWGMHLLMCGYSGASIQRFFEGILDRHRKYDIALVRTAREIRNWVETMQKGVGIPKREKFPILHVHIRLMLKLPRQDALGNWRLVWLRDVTMIVIATICALRLGEVIRLDVCDLMFDFDGEWTLALLLRYRKNDQMKRGLNPRVGRGSHPSTCPIQLAKDYMREAGIKKHPDCTKQTWRRSSCDKCGRFFRATTMGGKRVRTPTEKNHALSKDGVRNAVKNQLVRIGVVPTQFSGISMRKGGVSVALSGGVSQELRALQSGHRSISWQNYADVVKPEQLYDFFHAFGL